jgi:hypothetical protein
MKRGIKIIAIILAAIFFMAQSALALSGYVRYRSSSRPASYAIIIFKKHGKEVRRVLTDNNGFYYIALPNGRYGVKVKHKKRTQNEKLRIRSSNDRYDIAF